MSGNGTFVYVLAFNFFGDGLRDAGTHLDTPAQLAVQ